LNRARLTHLEAFKSLSRVEAYLPNLPKIEASDLKTTHISSYKIQSNKNIISQYKFKLPFILFTG